jgi:hypothetical protein
MMPYFKFNPQLIVSQGIKLTAGCHLLTFGYRLLLAGSGFFVRVPNYMHKSF